MSYSNPDMRLELQWEHHLVFKASAGEVNLKLDGGSQEGMTPVQVLLAAVGGCMGIDVVNILSRMHSPVESLNVTLEAMRNIENPKYVKAVNLRFKIKSKASSEQVERAVDLSRDKYCSVLHSLRSDLVFTTSIDLSAE